ncbi:glycosyltransferase family 4 protein [Limnobacter sp.]|uniref:glycosyltransferase family 4 protein n=1 Tax=Limnobacter sp. TaxID=2003368 RepID=UPI00391D834B
MQIALIADTFPPLRTSGAVQLRDLSREFARQGHTVSVLLPAPDLLSSWKIEEFDGTKVVRLKAPKTKDINYLRRTVAELAMPFFMWWNYRKSPLANTRWDGVVWYAPSIFHGPIVSALKKSSSCKSYLIIRDIFPEWAVDMGLMGRGLPYRFFKVVAQYQYSVADVIGVQTPGNKRYFEHWVKKPQRSLEVLQNWLDIPTQNRCPIRVADSALAGRKVFVYAGNMGIAQGMDILLELAQELLYRLDVGFLFVGRGSEVNRLKARASEQRLDNVVFFDEIDPDEIPDLYAQCDVGIVALDPRHKSHNIPGKFLTYMQSGIPVLANINAGNDLGVLVREKRVGQVCESNQLDELKELTEKLLDQIATDTDISLRCKQLFEQEFAVHKVVKQIIKGLSVNTISS